MKKQRQIKIITIEREKIISLLQSVRKRPTLYKMKSTKENHMNLNLNNSDKKGRDHPLNLFGERGLLGEERGESVGGRGEWFVICDWQCL